MRSLSVRVFLVLVALVSVQPVFGHDVTITGTQSFSSIDGSSSDHDGTANGVFTVTDGNLVVNGTVSCNDDSSTSACAMAFNVSGNLTVNAGGALYAENRTGSGNGAAISLTVGGNVALNGNAIVSSASKTNAGGTGGAIAANVGGSLSVASGATIDSGSAGAKAGDITITAGGVVTVNGNVLAGPGRTLLATRLTGDVLSAGTANQAGGKITIASSTFVEPALVVGATATIASQGEKDGAGPITLDGCGIEIRGLIAALSRKESPASVAIRSGKSILIDARDLNGAGTRLGRVRADSSQDGASNDGVDLFASENITVLGPTGAGALFAVSSVPGAKGTSDSGGTIRVVALEGSATASGRAFIAGADGKGTRGGKISIAAADDVNLDTATISSTGDLTKAKNGSAGGHIAARSYSGNVLWRNGTGDVRPLGSTSGVPLADQGTIVLTACGTVDLTGSSFPVNGVATSVHPQTVTGVCSPASPSLPAGVPVLVTCNTPPVADDTAASTNEDTTVTVTLSGSDADGDALTFTIVSGPANGTLGAIISTGPTTATVDYTPNLNYNGGDAFVFRADDGNGGTDDATATLTVAAVNDAPTFLAGPTVTVLEDSGAQTFPNWATSISSGPADESAQTVTFTVTNDNPSLFSVQPALASDGTLTFTPASNASGSATITVVAQDNGGTANGGDDTSNPQTSFINVTAVNDEPSFAAGPDQTVDEDSGSHSVANWATAISAGANESGQSLTFHVSNDNNALFSTQPSVSPTGTLTYTLAADANGSALVSVFLQDDGGTANGGDDTSATQTFTITVNAVNDAPSFTSGGNVTVDEDSGAYSAPWATSISAGPANESSQTVSFAVSNDNAALFAVAPSISPSGVLTFTLAANASGSANVTVTLSDNGGTANGGVDTSAPQTFAITINSVNDAPSFVAGGNVTVNEDSGNYSAGWATSISAGPNEGGQIVSFNTSNDNNGLFSAQPSLSATGVLSFTPALNQYGTATVTVSLSDNGGTANGGVDTSAPVTFTIAVTGVNDAPTAGADSWEILGNTELRVDLAAGTTPAVYDTTTSGTGVLDNDSDTAEGDPFTITAIVGCPDTTAPFDCTLSGARLVMEANGSFTFTPAPDATTASFQYVVTDQPAAGVPASATGTVTFTLYDMIWYVNAAAPAGGNGTSRAPFKTLPPISGGADADGPGDYLFIHTAAYFGHVDLEQGQRLWGEGVGLIIPRNLNGNGGPTVLVAPGVHPQIVSAAVDTIGVIGVSGTEVAGLNLTSGGGNAIHVESISAGPAAGVAIYGNTISGAALSGINVVGGSVAGTAVSINNTSIIATGHGLNVNGVEGTTAVSVTNGAILSLNGDGIHTDAQPGSSVKITGLANVAIDGNTSGVGINMAGTDFDANPATAAYETVNAPGVSVGSAGNPVGGAGIILSDVSGDVAFGTLTVFASTSGVTVNGSAPFTGVAGMRITTAGGSISAPAGVGLRITNATIGAANVNFTSINATGGANGILLNNTGTSGGLVVSGNGSANSGGALLNATGDAILLSSTKNVSLTDMTITNSGQSHIDATNVDGLALTRVSTDLSTEHGIVGSTVRNLVINGGLFDRGGAGAAVPNKHGVFITNLLGNSSVSGATFRRSNTIQFRVQNTTATAPFPGVPDVLTVSNTTWDTHTSPFAGDHLSVDSNTGGNLRLTVNGTGGNNNFTTGGVAIQATGSGSGRIDANVTGTRVTNTTAAVVVATTGTASGTFSIVGNKTANGTGFFNAGALAISILNTSTGSLNGAIDDNTVTNAPAGNGMQVILQGNGSGAVRITNNVVSGNIANNGIRAQASSGSGFLSLQVLNNNVNLTGPFSLDGINIEAGGSGAGHLNTICLNMSGNTSASPVTSDQGYRLRQRAGTTFNLQNFAGNGASTADISNWVNVTKANVGTTDIVIATTFSAAAGNCP